MIPEKTACQQPLPVSKHCSPVTARSHGDPSPQPHIRQPHQVNASLSIFPYMFLHSCNGTVNVFTLLLSADPPAPGCVHSTVQHQYTGSSQPSSQAWWAAAESEGSISFALSPQPTAHLCCTAVQDAVIPAGQECHCAYVS